MTKKRILTGAILTVLALVGIGAASNTPDARGGSGDWPFSSTR